LAAAAPMGPVNMLAIRRGVIGGWRHTVACGIGSVTGDLILFSLVLLGGHYLFSDLSNPTLQERFRLRLFRLRTSCHRDCRWHQSSHQRRDLHHLLRQ